MAGGYPGGFGCLDPEGSGEKTQELLPWLSPALSPWLVPLPGRTAVPREGDNQGRTVLTSGEGPGGTGSPVMDGEVA